MRLSRNKQRAFPFRTEHERGTLFVFPQICYKMQQYRQNKELSMQPIITLVIGFLALLTIIFIVSFLASILDLWLHRNEPRTYTTLGELWQLRRNRHG
jgi:Na+-transporting NADH:ubiquinone oxidoreductase subunit NqrE